MPPRLKALFGLLALATGAALLTACPAAADRPHPSRPAVPAAAGTVHRVLFDDTSAETAGNADWIVSTAMPDPTAQNPSPSRESDWTGAISAWGVALQRTGRYRVATLPPSGAITYGDSSNPQDLSGYDEFVLPEPNTALSTTAKTAIMSFVRAGGGLFMISDHNGSDRNNDGIDSVGVLNKLMTSNGVDNNDPFGFSIDVANIASDNPSVLGAQATPAVVNGPFGAVTGTIIRNGTTATLRPADNSAVRGEVFRTGSSASGTTGAAFVTSSFGSGRVAFWGDSSPIDDGTGQPGNTLYDGWDDPAGTDAAIALNATEWLAGGGTGGGSGGGTERVTAGGFESPGGWSYTGGAATTTARAHTGTTSVALCNVNSCSQTVSTSVTIPAGSGSATLSFWTYMTTQETSHPYDFLSAEIDGGKVATVSDGSPAGAWTRTSVPVTGHAGTTVTLSFAATTGSKYPTGFWLDDVSLLA